MDVEDALELLSPNFTHPVVRKYAVTRLKQACDEDLLLYLLQLVQALKYENFECIKAASLVSKNDDNSLVSRNEKVSRYDENDSNPTKILHAKTNNIIIKRPYFKFF